jgi:hypothetical protein
VRLRRRGRTTPSRAEATATLLPDGASHLSDGVLVETHLLARLLGMRLLRVEGTVLMSPARVVSGPRLDGDPSARRPPGVGPPVRSEVRSDVRPQVRSEIRPGTGLAEAARLLKSSDQALRSCRSRQVTGRFS